MRHNGDLSENDLVLEACYHGDDDESINQMRLLLDVTSLYISIYIEL